MRTVLTVIAALFLIACGDDDSSKETTNNIPDENNVSENNSSAGFGSWSLTIDGEFLNGGRVDPYYVENEDYLSLTLTSGPDAFRNLVIEIPGAGYGSTGTFSLILNDLTVVGGGDDYNCGSNLDAGDFVVTLNSVSETAVSGSYSGKLSCSEGVFDVTGSFVR